MTPYRVRWTAVRYYSVIVREYPTANELDVAKVPRQWHIFYLACV